MKKIKKLDTGKAFITKAYNLPSKYVIHTVGPIIYKDVTEKEKGIREIAVCSISTGEYRFPKDKACKIAIKAVNDFLTKDKQYFDKIVFNVFKDEDYNIYLKNLGEEYGKL